MSENIVSFSRLLRIFEFMSNSAYIIELEKNGQKTLYISYVEPKNFSHIFESYDETNLKEEFKNLSNHCLMSQCVNASSMFKNSPITHFEADCSSLVYASLMFKESKLNSIKTEFPLLEYGDRMFENTKLKKLNIDFPKLEDGSSMFSKSQLEKITSQFSMLENGRFMFEETLLKEVNCQFPNLKDKTGMFIGAQPELKQNYPYYFV